MKSKPDQLELRHVATSKDPKQIEILVTVLREGEIPHRASKNPDGSMLVMVPEEWEQEARKVLKPALESAVAQVNPSESEELDNHQGMYLFQDLPGPEETNLRPVWPAWVFALLPGVGLGHLYAGKAQIFLYLIFLSALGILLFYLSKSYSSFFLLAFSWALDLAFAAYHVKQHNRRALRRRKTVQAAER